MVSGKRRILNSDNDVKAISAVRLCPNNENTTNEVADTSKGVAVQKNTENARKYADLRMMARWGILDRNE